MSAVSSPAGAALEVVGQDYARPLAADARAGRSLRAYSGRIFYG
jgi:hypothetical protein